MGEGESRKGRDLEDGGREREGDEEGSEEGRVREEGDGGREERREGSGREGDGGSE